MKEQEAAGASSFDKIMDGGGVRSCCLVLHRLFYLSISPDLYASVAKYISSFARPPALSSSSWLYASVAKYIASFAGPPSLSPWLRVVFEKPFGRVSQAASPVHALLGRRDLTDVTPHTLTP